MAASLTRLIRTLPVPLFGSLNTAVSFTIAKSKALPRMAGWTVPLAIGGLWFVWPAVDDGWKIEMGFKSDPEAAAAAAAAAQENAAASKETESKITLSEEAMVKVENAYKAHEHNVDTDDDKLLSVAVKTGDYTALEEKWEEFNEKAIRPGEDDDEDEDEDDEDEEEEEEEED